MFMGQEMAIFRAKVTLVVTTKACKCLQYKKIEWLPDNHQRLQQLNNKWLQQRQNGKLLHRYKYCLHNRKDEWISNISY
jgi:hypothetical protein